MTEKLYDNDAYIKKFTATVISSKECDGGFITILDKTAFFPNEGGQYSDKGYIGDAKVYDAKLVDGEILHYTTKKVSGTVDCEIDFRRRFRNMQNHTGEHIISGIIHSLFQYENVGFHLGEDEVTCDYDKILSEEDIKKVEILANKAIYENRSISCYYPDKEELKNISYRFKKEIDEALRIVTIDGYDCCACCAPHVKRTGEIGIIKILASAKIRSGTRLFIACGSDALKDYCEKHQTVKNISALLAAKQNECDKAVENLKNTLKETTHALNILKQSLQKEKISKIEKTDGNIIIFTEKQDADSVRHLVNCAKDKCADICGCFSGNDDEGYFYIIFSHKTDIVALGKELNLVLNGKGGGKPPMIQGSVTKNRAEIEKFFSSALFLFL